MRAENVCLCCCRYSRFGERFRFLADSTIHRGNLIRHAFWATDASEFQESESEFMNGGGRLACWMAERTESVIDSLSHAFFVSDMLRLDFIVLHFGARHWTQLTTQKNADPFIASNRLACLLLIISHMWRKKQHKHIITSRTVLRCSSAISMPCSLIPGLCSYENHENSAWNLKKIMIMILAYFGQNSNLSDKYFDFDSVYSASSPAVLFAEWICCGKLMLDKVSNIYPNDLIFICLLIKYLRCTCSETLK